MRTILKLLGGIQSKYWEGYIPPIPPGFGTTAWSRTIPAFMCKSPASFSASLLSASASHFVYSGDGTKITKIRKLFERTKLPTSLPLCTG